MKQLPVFFCLLIICSCDIGELPIAAPLVNTETNTISMGTNYLNQVYYSIDKNLIVSQNQRTEWDIVFDSKPGTDAIYLNSSKFTQIWKVPKHTFDDLIDVEHAQWLWDFPCITNVNTAVGEVIDRTIYILDLGFDLNLGHSGYIKFQIKNSTEQGYLIRYASLNNSKDTTMFIEKDAHFSKLYFSFIHNSSVSIEPKSVEWDFLFTTYTHIFPDQSPYLVSGVLINTETISVAYDTLTSFSDININNIPNYYFDDCDDVIGYDWKTYSLSTNEYSINSSKSYIIRRYKDYFKLRFIDFYNDSGDKGYPKFEFQKL